MSAAIPLRASPTLCRVSPTSKSRKELWGACDTEFEIAELLGSTLVVSLEGLHGGEESGVLNAGILADM